MDEFSLKHEGRDRGTSGNGLFSLPLDVDDGLIAFEAQGSHGLVLVF